MPGNQQKCPDTSSENEEGKVHCHHTEVCTKWMSRRSQNHHWQTMLAHFNEAQGKCYEMCEEGLYSSFMSLLLSDVDPSDADNEDSSSEESSVERFNEGHSSSVISPQWPLAASQTQYLVLPTSPAPHEAIFNNGFIEEYDWWSNTISRQYTAEEEVRTSHSMYWTRWHANVKSLVSITHRSMGGSQAWAQSIDRWLRRPIHAIYWLFFWVR